MATDDGALCFRERDGTMGDNAEEIIKAFSNQAARFNEYQNSMFKDAFCERAIAAMELKGDETVLEVAAGTCAFGRMIAPSVKGVVELDLTEAMLDAGKAANEGAGISNVSYVIGNAESIPYEEGRFDAVVTRLSFHHFVHAEKIMSEMARVLPSGGCLAVIDMVPPFVESREAFDWLERLRDESHVRCFTAQELTDMGRRQGTSGIKTEEETIPMELAGWMELTDTSDRAQDEIREALLADLDRGVPSGMDPCLDEGHIMFRRQWASVVGRK